jgi:IclR family transcriptional regulator, acetate operon repressor
MTVVPHGTRVHSVSRAARLLMLIALLPEDECTIGRMARELETSVPTVYHLLNTLVDAQLLFRDERKRYHLGLAVGTLAAVYDRQNLPPAELLLPLHEIVSATEEGAYLHVWRDGNLEVMAHLVGWHAIRAVNWRPDLHGAAHARAPGKVLLAFAPALERQRYLSLHPLQPLTARTITDPAALMSELRLVEERGFATEEEEFSEGVACISVPIWDGDLLVGAYTVAAPIDRFQSRWEQYLTCLLGQARAPYGRAVDGSHRAGRVVALPDRASEAAVSS